MAPVPSLKYLLMALGLTGLGVAAACGDSPQPLASTDQDNIRSESGDGDDESGDGDDEEEVGDEEAGDGDDGSGDGDGDQPSGAGLPFP